MKNNKNSKFKYVVLIAVLFIPFMYSFFYLKAYWNPYGKGNIDNLPVAIVNEDKGKRGSELINQIKEKKKLKLSVVSNNKAQDGLNNKTYYAVITIPEDFSESIESINTNNKKHPTITYSPNQKSNYLASQIIDKVVSTVEANLDNTINSEIVGTLSNNLESVPNQLETISNGFETLNNGTNQLSLGGKQLESGTNTLSSSYKEFDNGLDKINSGSKTLNESMKTLNNGINTLSENTKEFNTLKESIPVLTSSVNTLTSTNTELTNSLDSYITNVNTMLQYEQTMAEKIVTMYDSYNLPKDEDYYKLQALLQKDEKTNLNKIETLTYVGGKINSSAKQINAGLCTLNEKTNSLNVLPTKIDELTTGIDKLQQGSNQITAGVNTLNTGINTLSVNSKKINSGINTLSTGATTLSNGLTTLDTSVTSSKKELNEKLDSTKKDVKKVETLKEYSKEPVKVNTKEVNKISSYGTAFSPFFISIALWVGCLMMYIVLYYDKENRFKKLSIDNNNHLQRTCLYHLIATASGILLAILLQLFLDFKITSIPLYYFSIILIANTFIAIIEFLIVNLKDVGKFVALILLVLQLAAAGGTFPIETVTKGFRWLHNLLPMSYTIDLLRESLVKIESTLLTKNLTLIITLCLVFVVINIVNDLIYNKKNN